MKVAVIVPCLNEELTIGRVVEDCRRHLPEAEVYVLDNGSTDDTSEQARLRGAQVIHSPLRGKGNVLRHAFRVIDADYYVMIDGDGTYPVHEARQLIDLAAKLNYEMVCGARLDNARPEAFRPLHYLGNRMFTNMVHVLFGFPVQDLLTGFRVFSKRFAKEVPLLSRGFEIETELSVRAMAQDMAFAEVPIPYVERPMGSHSKLRTFRDGWRILLTILRLWKDFYPLRFFSTTAALILIASYRWPNLQQLGYLLIAIGLMLDSQLRWRKLAQKKPQPQQIGQHSADHRRSA
jgi:glycosyltransferase involved in cell wall biosynthesis